MNIKEWKDLGEYASIDGYNLFYLDVGDKNRPIILILHGYPTSSYDYYKVIDYLIPNYRVIIHDHLGFGFSDKPNNYSYSLLDQAKMALKFWKILGVKEASVIGHDYGTSVLTEILALREDGFPDIPVINSIVLTNGSIHIELAQLRFIQKLLLHKITGPIISRLINKPTFIRNMKDIWFDASKITKEELSDTWGLITYNKGRRQFHKITQYINERYVYWDRWVGSLKRLDILCLILWAKDDPVAVKAIGEKLHKEIKGSELVLMDETGHFLMLERPDEWSANILKFLGTLNN